MMCYVCIVWCRAFTRTERALVALQLVLLAVFVALLTFLILHLVQCGLAAVEEPPATTTALTYFTHTTDASCSWLPSHKTEADTLYFLNVTTETSSQARLVTHAHNYIYILKSKDSAAVCTLTALDHFWLLTSARCLKGSALSSYIITDMDNNTYAVVRVVAHARLGVACVRVATAMPADGVTLHADVRAIMLTMGETLTAIGHTTNNTSVGQCAGAVRKVSCVGRERRHLSPPRNREPPVPRPLCVTPIPGQSGCTMADGSPLLADEQLVAVKGTGDAHTPVWQLRPWLAYVQSLQ